MIRNVCIHVTNEQPLLCDLYSLPSSADAGLVCTNVRSMDGRRPVFVDQVTSTFFFPYHVVRFLEIPEVEMASYYGGDDADPAADGQPDSPRSRAANGNGNGNGNGHRNGNDSPADRGSLVPIAVGAPDTLGEDDLDVDLEIDEGFLQRIRDI